MPKRLGRPPIITQRVRILVSLSQELRDRLRREAKMEQISESEVVRQSLLARLGDMAKSITPAEEIEKQQSLPQPVFPPDYVDPEMN